LGRARRKGRLLAAGVVLACAPLLLNPRLLVTLRGVAFRLDLVALQHGYPRALSAEGPVRGRPRGPAGPRPPRPPPPAPGVRPAARAVGYVGLFKAWLAGLRSGRAPARRRFAFASCVLATALAPLLVLARDDQHPYQFYKLLLSVSPLLVLGLALLWQYPPR